MGVLNATIDAEFESVLKKSKNDPKRLKAENFCTQ
jgi:hypothetical protein